MNAIKNDLIAPLSADVLASLNLIGIPTEVGQWMMDSGEREWSRYDDLGVFESYYGDLNAETTVFKDGDEGAEVTLTPAEFFFAHYRLIYKGGILPFAHKDYWSWANEVNGASADDYDDYTCDFVLQVLLYGKVIYG